MFAPWRRAEQISFFRDEAVAATAAVDSAIWDISTGQQFALWVEDISGSAPDLKFELTYYSGRAGGGASTTEIVVASVVSTPTTPYITLVLNNTPSLSVKCTVTGVASNGANTTTTAHLVKY